MKRKFKSIFALALAVAMCVSLMPMQTSAAQTSYTSSTGITINVDMSPFSFDPGYGTIYYVGEQMIKMRATDSQGNTVYQVRNFDGKVMCELSEGVFSSLKRFSEGLAWVQVYDEWTGKSGWGCINTSGELVIPAKYDVYMSDFSDGVAKVYANGKFGYIDKSGKEIVPCVYDEATPFGDGYAVVSNIYGVGLGKDGETKIINAKGETVWTSPTTRTDTTGMGTYCEVPDYRICDMFSAPVDGKVLLYSYDENNNYVYSIVGADGSIEKVSGLEVENMSHPPKYVGGGLIRDIKSGNWCLMNSSGTVIYPYVSMWDGNRDCNFGYGVSVCDVGDDQGVIDMNGQYVIPLGEFKFLSRFEDGSALARMVSDGSWKYCYLTIEGASQPSEPEPETPPASDEPSGWAAADVQRAIDSGIVPENLQSAYNQATTRAEFCALAVELYESVMGEEITERATFTDTDDINVQKMAGLGVVNGMGEGKFEPNSALTREQAATLLSRLAAAMDKPFEASEPTFADNGSVSDWASAAVGEMQKSGVMGGVGDNKFDPKGSYTREQSIITMLRTLDIVIIDS